MMEKCYVLWAKHLISGLSVKGSLSSTCLMTNDSCYPAGRRSKKNISFHVDCIISTAVAVAKSFCSLLSTTDNNTKCFGPPALSTQAVIRSLAPSTVHCLPTHNAENQTSCDGRVLWNTLNYVCSYNSLLCGSQSSEPVLIAIVSNCLLFNGHHVCGYIARLTLFKLDWIVQFAFNRSVAYSFS